MTGAAEIFDQITEKTTSIFPWPAAACRIYSSIATTVKAPFGIVEKLALM